MLWLVTIKCRYRIYHGGIWSYIDLRGRPLWVVPWVQRRTCTIIWQSPFQNPRSSFNLLWSGLMQTARERITSCWHAHRCVGKCGTLQPICFYPLFYNWHYGNSTHTPNKWHLLFLPVCVCVCRWRNLWRLLKKTWSWGASVAFLAGPLPNHSLPILFRITNLLLLTNLHSIHLTVTRH